MGGFKANQLSMQLMSLNGGSSAVLVRQPKLSSPAHGPNPQHMGQALSIWAKPSDSLSKIQDSLSKLQVLSIKILNIENFDDLNYLTSW